MVNNYNDINIIITKNTGEISYHISVYELYNYSTVHINQYHTSYEYDVTVYVCMYVACCSVPC